MILYKISNWNAVYETNDTRKLKRLTWIPVPNKHDGLGFRMVAAEKDGATLFAAWILIVELASKSDRDCRGVLWRDGIPLDARGMALMTGFPERIFSRALPFFSQPRIGWLLAEQWQTDLPLLPGTGGEFPDAGGKSPGRMEGKGMEENGPDQKEGTVGHAAKRSAGASPLSDSEWIATLKSDSAYQGLDVDREHARMLVWCRENKRQPNRRRFINWLNRCDKPMTTGSASRSTAKPVAEPASWKTFLNHEYPDSRFSAGQPNEAHEWSDIDRTTQLWLVAQMRKKGQL